MSATRTLASTLPVWTAGALPDMLAALARHAGLQPRERVVAPPSAAILSDPGALDRWIEESAASIDIEAEATDTGYPELARMLRGIGPALFRLPEDTASASPHRASFIAVVSAGRERITLLAPDLTTRRAPLELVRRALCAHLEEPVLPEALALLERAGVPSSRREASAYATLGERLSWQRIGGCWILRPPPAARFGRHLRTVGIASRLGLFVATHALQYALWLAGWWLIGRGALEGRLEIGWLVAWAMTLVTIVPLRMLETWLQGILAIGIGAALKQRLLVGALALDPDEIRHAGSGELLGQVIESEAIEGMALGGGFAGVVAIVEIALAVAVLASGAGGLVHAGLLFGWTALALALGWHTYRRRAAWTSRRLAITHDLIERMIGHRTRLAQERRDRRHDVEDQALDRYLAESRTLDRRTALLEAAVPRGWTLVGALGLLAPILAGAPASELAIAAGGMLLATLALQRLAYGMVSVASAAISWQQIAYLFRAASRPQIAGASVLSGTASLPAGGANGTTARAPLLEASDLVFGYREDGPPVIRGLSVAIDHGERVLLEGSSGGGKSTLASLLVGLRTPRSGLLMLRGLDRHAHGERSWRRRVVSAPQFHDNHVLMGTFAFNLLMGRAWPPSDADVEEGVAICTELGLGPLLERMPAGIMQNVGETGWQLSQGERSRLFIARALMQRADLIILDESFGALDPETLRGALECVIARAPSLVVIAHP